MNNYKKLNVWQNSHSLTLKIYEATKSFPKEELFGLTSQMRRAAVSIPSNLAEGTSRRSAKEFSRFIEIAQGSAFELEYQLFLSLEIGYLKSEAFNSINALLIRVLKELHNLQKSTG
jgi:four helix bundle protein